MRLVSLVFLAMSFAACAEEGAERTPFDYANPMIGTAGEGHTYPGATVPFGMVQLSPDTRYGFFEGNFTECCYHWAAGYRYEDSSILGFSHTHFNGTGHSDLGDLLIMPTVGDVQLAPGSRENPDSGYRSRFTHETEVAEPGYYAVDLDDYNIRAEMTATTRVGVHRYTFPQADNAHFIIDLSHAIYNHKDRVTWSQMQVVDSQTIVGYRINNGWAKYRPIYFAIEFSKPFETYGLVDEKRADQYNQYFRSKDFGSSKSHITTPEIQGKGLKAYVNFSTEKDEQIVLRVGISYVSPEGALKNLRAEMPDWDFDRVRADARNKWEAELDKVQIEGAVEDKESFYSALYHTALGPIVYNDVDGKYRGLDQNIHETDVPNYTIFSLWDTYRALHPLFTYTQRERVGDMVTSMLEHYKQSPEKLLPIWSFHSNETWTMIGYHATSVISDAYLKGIRNFDIDLAWQAVEDTANNGDFEGLDQYLANGYVAHDLQNESASKTAEYAYDDFAISQFAKALGKDEAYERYLKRSYNYKNIFDTSTGFMRGRNADGSWETPFDPEVATKRSAFTEGSAMQYSWYAPHDTAGLIDLIGGNDVFVDRLDKLFDTEVDHEKVKEHEDMAGFVGQYVQGNEPSHHIAYLYNYAGKPWKTQERINQILNSMYSNKPNGIPGNDDLGQMSAWYIFTAMGFYPMAPGDLTYAIGAPRLSEVSFGVEGDKRFKMKAHNQSPENIYIDKVLLNGNPHDKSFIRHVDIASGSTLEFFMSDKPNKEWASSPESVPPSISRQ